MATSGIHHVELVSGDARRTLAFYRDLLGMRLLKRTVLAGGAPAYRLYFGFGSGRPGTLLSFVEEPGGRQGRPGIGGVHHTAFGVQDDERLVMWKRRLTDAGVPVSGPYDRGYFTSIYFRDPDGQVLEIATEGPGYAIDEPADRLGGELTLPPQRIVRGHRDEAAIRRLNHPDPVPQITPEMELSGIHHVSGITDDLDGMGAFLEEVLGLALIKKTTNRDDPDVLHYFWARYDGQQVAPHSAYTLFGWPSNWNEARAGVGQTRYIAFRARGEQALNDATERLRAMGIDTEEAPDARYFRGIRFTAPDGQQMELTTDGPGFSVDEEENELGTKLTLPSPLESRRAEIEEELGPLD